MQKITTFLLMKENAEEVMNFYTSVFKNSKVGSVNRFGETGPWKPGSIMVASFEIEGITINILNGGPNVQLTEAFSLSVGCEDQAEIDYYWEKLTAGGEESMCGWLKDKYGMSWQIVPKKWGDLMSGPDKAASGRAMQAMMQMRKFDLAKLQAAYDGK